MRPCALPCFVLAVALAVLCPLVGSQTPVLTEFMASNGNSIKDQDGDSSDWAEVHNPSASTIDLGGWHLTDDASSLTKWKFPSPTPIPAGGFLVVYCSNKNRAISGKQLHTNFKLSSVGEYFALTDSLGKVMSAFAPSFPQQVTDVSYGFSFNPKLTTTQVYFTISTPGGANNVGGAVFRSVTAMPKAPKTTDDIVVEAELILAPASKAVSVTLVSRIDFALEKNAAMLDDGKGRDRQANDGIWTGVIGSAAHAPGQMVRWKVFAWLQPLGIAQAPVNRNSYNAPEYFGAMIADPSVASKLPILHWFVQNPSLAETATGTRCSLWFNGEFYDNIAVRRRGGSSTGWAKKNFKFDFNSGFHFQFDVAEGAAEEFNLNSTWSDKSYVRRILSWDTYEQAGSPYCICFPMRVQQNGRFFSVATFVEQPDIRLLDRIGLDPSGALYKMFNPITSATSRVEKKTRQSESNADLQQLVSGIQLSGSALEHYLFDNVDIPATLSYMVATVVVHDNDHVHKNHYLYRDTEGDGEWMFLPWDKDLTLGRNYIRGLGVLNDTIWARHDPQSHPLYGHRSYPKTDGFWNRLIDACHRIPRIREMYLRRLRSVMDDLLQDPTVPRTSLKYEKYMDGLRASMGPDVALDRQRWGIPSWGNRTIDFATALGRLENEYFKIRRQHLFVTHSSSVSGIIPPPQPKVVQADFGQIVASPASNNQDEEFIEIVNCATRAIDITGWHLKGGVTFTFSPGTVIPAGGSVFASPNLKAFRARTTGPRGGQGLFVVGPYEGKLGATEELFLEDANDVRVSFVGGPSFDFTTQGNGDMRIAIAGAKPLSHLFILYSAITTHRIGCGPVLGLGFDGLFSTGFPVGTHPFHVLASATGTYNFTAPPATLPKGLTLDARVAEVALPLSIRLSRIVRLRF
ncbi:MAG: hypothetical protein CMJ85_01015 [Planctomycetes bacterium]|nr:hypothetical protein [Planctomycetota bacterium]